MSSLRFPDPNRLFEYSSPLNALRHRIEALSSSIPVWIVISLMLVAVWMCSTSIVAAADITLSDTCSLANAIRSANGDDQVAPADECAEGDDSGTDQIFFVDDVVITEALPAIASDVRIVGGHELSPPERTPEDTTEYNFSLLTINSGAVRIENLYLYDADDTALKIIKNTTNNLEVLFNLGGIGNNNAATHGGAIHIEGGAKLTIHLSRIGNNSAPNGNGGAIYVKNSTLKIKFSDLPDNSAAGNGAAIYFVNDSADEHSLAVNGSSFGRNQATDKDDSTDANENGGAIYIQNAVSTDGAISSLDSNSFTENIARNGGAVYLANGKLTIDNSTIDESIASGEGGGVYVAGGNLTVRHATIVNNQAATGSGIGVFSDDDENTTDPEVYVYNSIIAQNTDTDTENSVCLTDLLTENAGNIIDDDNCVEAQSAAVPVRIELVPFSGDNLPRAVISRFYRLLEDSPAIDNGVAVEGQMLGLDQTGHRRPEGEGYDSGAFEFDFEEVWVLPTYANGSESSDSESDETSASAKPKALAHTCVAVHERDNGINIQATHGLYSGVQCQEIDASGIGIQSVIDVGFVKAVDVWGYVEQGVQVCFDATGPMVFLDSATAPRTVHSIDTFTIAAKTCTSIWRAGSVVLKLPHSSASAWPAATAQPLTRPSPTPATQCLGSATAAINLRDAPNGNRIGGIYPNQTMTVHGSADGWYQVNFIAKIGWVSAAYVSLSGECDSLTG